MKRFLRLAFGLIFLVVLAFSTGIGVAELQIRFQRNIQSKTVYQSEPARPIETAESTVSTDNSPANNTEPELAPEPTLLTPQENQENKFSFAILGDTQYFDSGNSNGGLQRAIRNIKNQNVSLVMTEGDLLSSCDGGTKCQEGYNNWKNVLGSLAPVTYEVQGNHDRTGREKSDQVWQNSFDLPQNGPEGYKELVYSFDYQNSHFVVLSSEKPKGNRINVIQRDWLEKDLLANKKENTFVFFHEPAYPVSSKIDESLDVEKADRNALWEILKRYKVTAVFNGHEHIASRRKVGGVYQFVFGNTNSFDHDLPAPGLADYAYQGENFGVVGVSGKNITVKTYTVDGKLADTFQF